MAWLLVAVLLGLVAWSGVRIERLQRDLRHRLTDDHTLTTAIALEAVSDKVKADALRDAAEAWTTIEAETERKRLSWTPQVRNAENKSLVAPWLNNRADQIEGVRDDAGV